MASIPQPRFSWREPKAFIDATTRERRRQLYWVRPFLVAIFVAMIMLSWCFPRSSRARRYPAKEPISFSIITGLGLSLGLFFVYALPSIVDRWSTAVLYDGGVQCARVLGRRIVRWSEVMSFTWESTPKYRALVLSLKDGKTLSFGLPPDFRIDDVAAYLHSRGLQESSMAKKLLPDTIAPATE
jgi:hypothetical protein